METTMLALLALVALTAAGPITVHESQKCAETCAPSTNFKYEPGTTYTYIYRVDTETTMAGASQDTAKLTVQSSADIHVLSECEFSLSLRNTRLITSDASGSMKPAQGESMFAKRVEESPLRFSFQNGKVASVCPAPEEEAAVLNIKKAVLSAFQNSMDDVTISQNVTENDISGSCDTVYTVPSVGYYTTEVKKVKDALTCVGRHQYDSMLHMTPYNVPSELQNAPIMKTTLECTQEIKNGAQLSSSECTETLVYRPFSDGVNGARTIVKQSLTYSTYSKEVKQPTPITGHVPLTFDPSQQNQATSRRTVEKLLREICSETRYDVRPESPAQFSALVTAMRGVADDDLTDLHRLLRTKSLCGDNDKTYKFFLDALPLLSTDASIKLMSDLILGGDVKPALAKAWIISLGFVNNPTAAMLVNAKTLIDNDKTAILAMLPVSSMVHNYCRRTECLEDVAVLSVIMSLERNIGYRCDTKGNKLQKVILSLRAIGNAGHATRASNLISTCMTNSKNPMEVKIAAAQAFRRMPCDAKDDDLLDVFENSKLDSELRINAYISLMRCPAEKTMCKMAASLENEKDEQVASFVYSHLKNLQKTSDPHKEEVAKAAANLKFPKEFNMNPIEFSRHYEASLLLNRLNAGFSTEGNLIWSKDSKVPRSLSGNLTVDLFGQAINLFDFGARVEGMEYLLTKLWGEQGDKKYKSSDMEASVYGRVFGNEMLFLHSRTAPEMDEVMPNWLEMIIGMANKKKDYTLTQSAQFLDVSLVIPTIAGLPVTLDLNGTGTVDLVLNGKADLKKANTNPRSLDIDGEIRPSAAVEVTGTMAVDALVTRTGLRMRNTLHTSTQLKGRITLQRGQTLNVELDTPQDKMEVFTASSKFFILHDEGEQEQDMITENRKEFAFCSGDNTAQIIGMELCGQLAYPNASTTAGSPHFPFSGPLAASLVLHKRDDHVSYKLFAKRVENKKASIAQISFNTPGSKVDRALLLEAEINYPKRTLGMELRSPWKKASIKGETINTDKMKSLSGSLKIDDADEYAFVSEVKIDKTKAKIQLSPMFELRRTGADNIQLSGFMTLMTPAKGANLELSLSGLSKLPYTLKGKMTNNKKEGRGIVGTFSTDDKNKYTLEANSQFAVMGKKAIIADIKNTFKVATPTKQLISFTSNANYKEGKSVKADAMLDIYRLIKKPATLKISLVKNEKKRGVRYDADVLIKADKLGAKLDSFTMIKSSGLVATKHILSYTIPKVAKNKITLGGKFNDRSNKAYNKYTLKSNLDIQKNPDYNMGLNVAVDHKKKHSSAEVELKYGKNPKDKTKRLFWSTSLNRKQLTPKAANLIYKMDAEAPEHNVDISVIGKHVHSPKSLDSNLNINYGGKGKDLTAEVSLKDKSNNKLSKFIGKGAISGFGKEYSIATNLDQKSANQYNHVLNLKGDKSKHNVVTTYKVAKGKDHSFKTKIAIQGMKPLTLSGSTNLDTRNFDLSGEVAMGKNAYGFNSNTKLTKAPSAKVDWELYYPKRRMTLLVDGGKKQGKYTGKVETSWDADSKDAKITVDGSAYTKKAKNALSVGAEIAVTSPFTKDFSSEFKYGQDDSQHDMNGKIIYGKDLISSSLNVKKPFSLENIKMKADAKTPFDGFKVAMIDIDHTLTPSLKTTIDGKLDKNNGKLIVEGSGVMNNFKGTAALKTSIKGLKSVKLNVGHALDDGKLASNAELDINGKSYSYDMDMAHSQKNWDIKNLGNIMVSQPGSKAKTSWKHTSSDKDIKTDVSADYGKNHWEINLDGSHDLLNTGKLNGDLTITTPLKSMKKTIFTINHQHGSNNLINKASLKRNGKMEGSSLLKFKGEPLDHSVEFALDTPFHKKIDGKISNKVSAFPMTTEAEINYGPKHKATVSGEMDFTSSNINGDFALTSPWNKDISAKINTKYDSYPLTALAEFNHGGSKSTADGSFDFKSTSLNAKLDIVSPYSKDINAKANIKMNNYPYTGLAELSWAPKSKIVLEATVDTPHIDDASVELKLTTPFRGYRNFIAKASNKADNGEIVSNIDFTYGVRKSFDIETRIAMSDMKKMARLSLRTPFDEMKSLTTGFEATGEATDFDGSADFEMVPIVGKLKTNVNWQLDTKSGELTGTVRVDTPFKDYPLFALRTESKNNGPVRKSKVTFVHHPRQVYSLDVTNKFDLPFSFEANINSPFPEFDNLGLAIQHDHSDTTVKSHAEVTYKPGQKVEGDLNADWSSDIEGSFVVKTPFSGYETSKVAVKHQGSLLDFETHGEATVAEQTVVADASFKHNKATEGKLTFTSPIPGMNNLEISFNRQGTMKKANGQATITVDGETAQASFNHKMNKGIKSAFSLDTPWTETLKMSVDHDGSLESFTNKLSFEFGKTYDVDTVVSFDIQGSDISGNGLLKAKLNGKRNTLRLSFSKNGIIKDISFSGSASLNKNTISLDGSWKLIDSVEGSIKIVTPFEDFTNLGMSLSHTGNMLNFNTETNMNIEDKRINGKVVLSSSGFDRIRYDLEVTTPFEVMKLTKLNFEHDNQDEDVNGKATFETTIGKFGKGSIGYSKTGNLDKFTAQVNGKYDDNEAVVSVSKNGDFEDLTFSSSASFNRDAVSVDGSLKTNNGIDGNINVKTPFENFRNLGLKVEHRGQIRDFFSKASLDYTDSKNINSMIEFTANDISSIKVTSELNTPDELIGNSRLSFTNDVNGNQIVTKGDVSCILGTCELLFTKSGTMNDLSVEAKATVNGENMFTAAATNNFISQKSLKSFASLETAMTPKMEITVGHSGNILTNFKTTVAGKYGSSNMMSAEASMSQNGDATDAEAKAMYSTTTGSNQGSLKIHHEGQMDDFSVTIDGDLNNDKINFNGALKVKDEIAGSMTINTPLYKNVGMTFTHSGTPENFKTNGELNLPEGQKYSAKLNFYKYMLQRVETVLEVKTPITNFEFNKFEYRHQGNDDSVTCYSSLEYGDSKQIIFNMNSGMSPNPTMTVTLTTPFPKYEDMSATATLKNNLPAKSSVAIKVNAGNGMDASLEGSLNLEDISGDLDIITPFKGFTDICLGFKHTGTLMDFKSEGKVRYMDNKEIEGKITVKGRDVYIEVKTPFEGHKFISFEHKDTFTKKMYKSSGTTNYNGDVYKFTDKWVLNPDFEVHMTWTSPIKGFETIEFNNVLDFTKPDFSLESNLKMKKNIYDLKSSLIVGNDIKGSLLLKAPKTGIKKMGFEFDHSGSLSQFDTNGRVFADKDEITGKVSFYNYMWKKLSASAELTTPFIDWESNKAEVEYDIGTEKMSASAMYNGQTVDGVMEIKYSPKFDFDLTINTPVAGYKKMKAFATADTTSPKYSVSAGVSKGPQSYKATGKLNFNSVRKMDASLEVKTPIENYDLTKAEYEHNIDSTSVYGKASLSCKKDTVSAELQATNYPTYDGTFTVKTPYDGYNTIQGSASFETSYNKYDTFASLKMDGNSLFSMTSGFDYSLQPMKAFAKLTAPHDMIKTTEITLTHQGSPLSFKSTGAFNSPITDSVNADAAFDFKELMDMSLSGSFKSSLPGFDNIRTEVKTSDISGEKRVSAVAGWTDGKQIVSEASLRNTENWREASMAADFTLATPFKNLNDFAIQTEGSSKDEGKDGKLAITLNGGKVLDIKGDYTSGDKKEATVTFKEPREMKFIGSVSNKEVDVYANWDMNDRNSYFHVLATGEDNSASASVLDRNFDVTVEHASKKMGVSHTHMMNDDKVGSTGKLFWGPSDDDKVSYNFDLTINDRRNKKIIDHVFKLALPSRTLELSGSMINSPSAKTADTSFKWDADRDENKCVGLKVTVATGNTLRGDVTFSLPAIQKEIKFDGELMLNNGKILLDSKTDFIYSTDSRKTVTLTSKVKRTSKKNMNYTVEMGLSHPYTNIDVQMISSVGNSDEKMTFGMETSYLTDKKKTKTLALLTEINKMKKQISMQMMNPLNNIELLGEVVNESPLTLKLTSGSIQSNLVLDADKKSVELTSDIAGEKYAINAEFPSCKDFGAYVVINDQKEAVFALHLNNSRLLHSRMAYRPAPFTQLTNQLNKWLAISGIEYGQEFAKINNDIADEIEAKWNAVSKHIKEEFTPYIDELEQTLMEIGAELSNMQVAAPAQDKFRVSSMEVVSGLRAAVDDMVAFPARSAYRDAVNEMIISVSQEIMTYLAGMEHLTSSMKDGLQQHLEKLRTTAESLRDSVNYNKITNYAQDMMDRARNVDVSPYVEMFKVPDQYSSYASEFQDLTMSGVKTLWARPELSGVRGPVNALYQEAAWAYKYWDVEKNVQQNVHDIMNLLVDIVKVEVKQMTPTVTGFESPITVYTDNEIQADLKLPFNFNCLYEMPDFQPFITDCEKLSEKVGQYLPSKTALDNAIQTVTGMFQDEPAEVKDMKKYKPSKKMLKKAKKLSKKGKKYNKRM